MLNERGKTVLATIIEEYIAQGAPVCSAAVAKSSKLSLSSASIRNIMAELAEEGYLAQPHTSAGRIPTNKAFRLYVDKLITPSPVANTERLNISTFLDRQNFEISTLLRQAAETLSVRCNHISMLLFPQPESARWSNIGFVQAGAGKILAVLALQGGLVETRLINVSTDFKADELLHFGNYLNENFKGVPLAEARQRIEEELAGAKARLENMFRQALILAGQAVDEISLHREVFVEGMRSIIEQVGSTHQDSAMEIFDFLEERSRLLELLDGTISKKNVQISFWDETEPLAGCSLVSAPYGSGTPLGGVMGIIGPSRMNYNEVLPIVSCISEVLTLILQRRALE